MLRKSDAIKIIKEKYNYLSSEYGVEKVGLFGSIVKDSITEESDIDIIVELRQPIGFRFIELVEYFEKLFGRKVDVITKDGLRNIRIKKIAEGIRGNIIYV